MSCAFYSFFVKSHGELLTPSKHLLMQSFILFFFYTYMNRKLWMPNLHQFVEFYDVFPAIKKFISIKMKMKSKCKLNHDNFVPSLVTRYALHWTLLFPYFSSLIPFFYLFIWRNGHGIFKFLIKVVYSL